MFIYAYAKLNLALNITGKLPNGYHSLDMVMQTIDLYDIIQIERASKTKVTSNTRLDPQHNTAFRAAELFFSYTGIKSAVRIHLNKNIPAQAGLGGGSSNGAAVLRGLNELYQTKLTIEELEQLALQIGADTPFFIRGGCMRAQGVGQELRPVQNNLDLQYLLIQPNGGVDTASAYRLYSGSEKTAVTAAWVEQALKDGNLQNFTNYTDNALYPAAKELCPQVGEIIQDCYESGAQFAMMTGSGSCVFAVYENTAKLQQAALQFQPRYPFVSIAKNISHGSNIQHVLPGKTAFVPRYTAAYFSSEAARRLIASKKASSISF